MKLSESDSRTEVQEAQPQIISTVHKLLYPKPKVLLVDLKDESEKILKSAGYKIDVGTFGESYKVEKSKYYELITSTASLPNFEEQEIIIIDLTPPKIKEKSLLEKDQAIIGNSYFWTKSNLGFVDTRPATMSAISSSFDNILKHGGVFIIFADSRTSLETVYAKETSAGIDIKINNIDNWSFLSAFDRKIFTANYSNGKEISVETKENNFYKNLEKNIKDSNYSCTLKPLTDYQQGYESIHNRYFNSWISTANDKYGNSVAGAFAPTNSSEGWVFVFPQIKNKSSFLLEFLRDVLPELAPKLFPYSDNKNWIERSEYQPISVRDLNRQIEQIEVEAKQKIEKINEEIQQEKEKIEYQSKLLTTNDDSLVEAIEKTFKVLGFTNVINVDEEYEKQGKTNSNDEDLWIRDKPMSLLVEIKGVSGFPSDDDSRQVTKHLPIRMREWNDVNVKTLTIINHQKAIPALDRDKEPFRPLIVESAKEQHLGLMTTFDLYRLVRSFLKNGWKHENIKDLFIQSGHISIVPVHYEYVGVIEHYWEKPGVVGIRVEENAVKLGDTISFELPIEFEEMNVNSLQVENTPTEIAEISMLAGIKINLTKDILKKGIKVFRIITPKP